jgi:prenyltransferase beta subunit
MRIRRQCAVLAFAALAVVACTAVFGFQGEEGDKVPDGSAAKGMIDQKTQDVIDHGLKYLADHQNATSGSFPGGINNNYQNNVAVTSLAGLAMMAGGNQPNRGRYGQQVTRCLRFVLDTATQSGSGWLLSKGNAGGFRGFSSPAMYEHGFGTLFLAEVSGMVPDKKLREELRTKLKGAVQVILHAQHESGGWRYSPSPLDADLSVTICQIMALRAARNAGIDVPKSTVDRCNDYVKKSQNFDGGFRYQLAGRGNPFGESSGFARSAAGVVALYSAGIYKDKSVKDGLNYLLNNFKPGNLRPGGFGIHDPSHYYFYGHYYAAQAMWIAGGKYWQEWFPAIRDELIKRRGPDGNWNDNVSPSYATAMACIILQIPNNYLPILQK